LFFKLTAVDGETNPSKIKENIYWNDTQGKKKFNGRHRQKGKNIFSVAHKGMRFCQEHIRDLIFFMKDKL
jgi:hypothetical protein